MENLTFGDSFPTRLKTVLTSVPEIFKHPKRQKLIEIIRVTMPITETQNGGR